MSRRLAIESVEHRRLLSVLSPLATTAAADGLTVTVNQAAAQSDPAQTAPVNFSVVFSAPVSDFDAGDVTVNFARYHLTDLGTLGGTQSYAYGINDQGQVVGYSLLAGDGNAHAFRYDGTTLIDLGTLGGDSSAAYDINNSGNVVGYAETGPGSTSRAFLHDGATMRDLGTLGGSGSAAFGINDAGQIVGWSNTTGDAGEHAFLYSGSVMTDLGTLGGSVSNAFGISNSGRIVGDSKITTASDAVTHAFMHEGTTMTDLGSLGADSHAVRVNDRGQIIGYASVSGSSHAFVHDGTTMTDLGTLGGTQSAAYGINDQGQIVGWSSTAGGAYHGFLRAGSSLLDLNWLLDSSGQGWVFNAAWDINSSGQIAGFGTGPSGSTHAVLLTPVSVAGSAPGVLVTPVGGDGTTYNVAVAGFAGAGLVTASVAAGAAHDAGDFPNAASTSSDNWVYFDAPPTVTINQATNQADAASTDPIHFTVVFSEPVTGFSESSVTLGGTAGGERMVTVAPLGSDGLTYDVAVRGLTQSGTVIATIAAGAVTDSGGNANAASTSTDNTVTYQRPEGPVLAYLPDVTVHAGAPLNIALNGDDLLDGPLTYSIVSSNPALATLVPQGNSSLRITMQGFGDDGGDGVMVLQLFQDLAPNTTARIIQLTQTPREGQPAGTGFYDGLTFHRVIADFMIQGGDPAGTGSGGSGVDFDDEFNATLRLTGPGVLAMAKSSDDTNDSQFFITDTATRWLDFNHTVFGLLTEGDKVRQAIQAVPVSGDRPLSPPVMKSVETFVDQENGVLRLSAALGTSGEADVTVTATDSQGRTATRVFHVTIAADPAANNGQPFLQSIEPIRTTAGVPVSFQLTSVDVEGDAVTYSVPQSSTDITVQVNAATGTGTLTPGAGVVGVRQIKVAVARAVAAGSSIDEQAVPVFIHPAAPTGIELLSQSDTGDSAADRLTHRNNGSSAAALTFRVSGVLSGTTVRLFAGDQLLGEGLASSDTVDITTNGSVLLPDGPHAITAVQVLAGQAVEVGNLHETVDLPSEASAPLVITVDALSPEVTINQAAIQSDPTSDATIRFTAVFSEAVSGFGPGGVTVVSSGSGTLAVVVTPVGFDGTTYDVAVSGMSGSGAVTATIAAGAATDAAGNSNTASTSTDNQILYTAANRSPVVNNQSFTVPRNSPNGAEVGVVEATDPDQPEQTLSYAIAVGNSSGAFAIDTSTGRISIADASQLGNGTPIVLIVQVTDSAATPLSDTATVTVEFSGVNQAPAINNQNFVIAENSPTGTLVGAVTATDPDSPAQTLAYTITAGNDSGAFTIEEGTGRIIVADASKLDYETASVFQLTVQVTDSAASPLSTSATITVNLGDVNEAPVLADQSFTLAENSPNGTVVGTATAGDPDSPAQTLTYTITAGNGSGAFAINPASGQITVADASKLDFETAAVFQLTIQAADSGSPSLSDTAAVTVHLSDVNEAPTLNDQAFTLAANSPTGTIVGTLTATDPDRPAQTLSYTITAGNGSGIFAIDAASGQITVADASKLISATTSVIQLTIRAADNGATSLSDTAVVTINLTNVNLAPVVNNQAFTLPENSAAGTVVGTVAATDQNQPSQTLTYSIIAGNGSGAFAINAATGRITVADASKLDYETTPVFQITVQVTDNGAPPLSDTAVVTINLGNVSDEPDWVYQAPGGTGENRITLRRAGQRLQLVNSASGAVIEERSLATTRSLSFQGANSKADILTIDFASGGVFAVPGGIAFDGGMGTAVDELIVRGGKGADRFDLRGERLTANGQPLSVAGAERIRLEGGTGNDLYHLVAANAAVTIVDTAGVDQVNFCGAAGGVTVSLTLPSGRAQRIAPWGTTLAISGTLENLVGTYHADVLTGNSANNRIRGLGGNDAIHGGGGTDICRGEGGNDTLYADGGRAVLLGGAGNDVLYGGSDTALLIGGAGADELLGGRRESTLVGGSTSYDANDRALLALLADGARKGRLNSIHDYMNGNTATPYLQGGTTVHDDATLDRLWGGGGFTWFLGSRQEMLQ